MFQFSDVPGIQIPYYGNSFQCIYCSIKDPKLTHPADALYYIISALKANWA